MIVHSLSDVREFEKQNASLRESRDDVSNESLENLVLLLTMLSSLKQDTRNESFLM